MEGFDGNVNKILLTSRELILHAIQYSPPTAFHPIPDKQNWPYVALIQPLKFNPIRPYIFSLKESSGTSYTFQKCSLISSPKQPSKKTSQSFQEIYVYFKFI
jgi:hypothetical protein